MVYLNRIYTKSGDAGQTSLGDGSRVAKTNRRIVSFGVVDELNSVLGVALTAPLCDETAGWLRSIQNDLFDLGADLCVPESQSPSEAKKPPLRVTSEQVTQLETWIDTVNERLDPLESFILPGGCPAAAHLHHARTVCRRVEISVLEFAEQESINTHITIYLNRLSDLLFVLARAANNNGTNDVLWIPGQNRDR